MSRSNLGCKFCDEWQFETEGSIKIAQKDINDKLWLELFMLDDKTLTAFATTKDGWDPIQEIKLHINNCPMCGRKLYSKQEDRNEEYDFGKEKNNNNRESNGRKEHKRQSGKSRKRRLSGNSNMGRDVEDTLGVSI